MGARPAPARGRSVGAVRCAVISTAALLACIVAQGSLRAVLAFVWVTTVIAALALEWNARRRVPPAPVAVAPKGGRRRPPARRGR